LINFQTLVAWVSGGTEILLAPYRDFYVDAKDVVAHGPIRRVRLLFDFSQVQQDPDTLIETSLDRRSRIDRLSASLARTDRSRELHGEHGTRSHCY